MSSADTDALLRIFDPDPREAAIKYAALFRRLLRYFRWRHPAAAEDLAQETLKKGFGLIRAGKEIYTSDPTPYFLKIAGYVAMEHRRPTPLDFAKTLDDLPAPETIDFRRAEVRICVEQCLRLLPPAEREFLSRYLVEDHKALAASLSLKLKHVHVKAHRIREKLEVLVRRANTMDRGAVGVAGTSAFLGVKT